MNKSGKKIKSAKEKFDSKKIYDLIDAIKLVKDLSFTKFDSSIDLAIKLNLDVRHVEQQLRGSIALPHGIGKKKNIMVATDNGAIVDELKKLGATEVVDSKTLERKLNDKEINFDVLVVEPKMMTILGKFGRLLGPKGLMPNPKDGTVTPNLEKVVTEISKGKASYRTDKNGIIHTMIGKVSMKPESLLENGQLIIETIKKLKPNVVKGTYFQTMNISSTMGPNIKVKIEH